VTPNTEYRAPNERMRTMNKTTVINAEYGKECNIKVGKLYVNIVPDYILISQKYIEDMTDDDFDDFVNCRGFDRADGEAYYHGFDGFIEGKTRVSKALCRRVVRQIDWYVSEYNLFPDANTAELVANLMSYRLMYEFKAEYLLDVSQDTLDAITKEMLDCCEDFAYMTARIVRFAYRDCLSQLCYDGTAIGWSHDMLPIPIDAIEAKEAELLAKWKLLK